MDAVIAGKPKRMPKPKKPRIPQELIYEMVDGKPIYYREYKKVLTKQKTMEEIMGSSFFQAELVALIVGYLMRMLNLSKYVVTTNELGFIYTPKNWRILDIGIFAREKVQAELLSTKYVTTAPEVVIEVDTKADIPAAGDILSYVTKKTNHLLEAGVEKVIWIFTESRNVLVAEPGKQWSIARWNDPIPVLEDVVINLEQLVQTLVSGKVE